MAKQYRQNTSYTEIVKGGENDSDDKKGEGPGNTGLPFGLCKKYGIVLPPKATPRDAWQALKDRTGMAPDDFYKDLRKGAKEVNAASDEGAKRGKKFIPAATAYEAEMFARDSLGNRACRL